MKLSKFSGIDISKATLDVTLYLQKAGDKSPHIEVSNDLRGFKKIVSWLRKQKISKTEVFFCLEHTGIYGLDLFSYFEEKGITYTVVSALHIKRSLGLTRGKNDKIDSYKISRFCYLHSHELKPSKLPSGKLQSLKLLLNERERLVKMQTVEKQTLKEFNEIISESSSIRSKLLLKTLKMQIAEIETEMQELINQSPELKEKYELAASVTGVGLVNAALFLVYSNNFEGFSDGRKYACYCGVAPFENSSGSSVRGKTRVSRLANQRVKTNLTMAARSAVQHDPELKKYYKRKEKEGKEHGTIMNAVKFKIILRVFATVKRGTPFVTMNKAG